MRVLRIGMSGVDVQQWQLFLVGQGFYRGTANGAFDVEVKQATIDFQRSRNLSDDGVVGDQTFGAAMQLGLPITTDTDTDQKGPNWPEVPPGMTPLVSLASKQAAFGSFTFEAAPTVSNHEAIKITNDWATQNLELIDTPQLAGVGVHRVYFNKAGSEQLQGLLAAWSDAGLLNLILSWDGSYAPRFIRGSTTTLSNHAWGSAFDINARWNPLGARPALVDQAGSTRLLVPLANKWGFYWGGHFGGRQDGMHFEVCRPPDP